jgi:hypothetical protein
MTFPYNVDMEKIKKIINKINSLDELPKMKTIRKKVYLFFSDGYRLNIKDAEELSLYLTYLVERRKRCSAILKSKEKKINDLISEIRDNF